MKYLFAKTVFSYGLALWMLVTTCSFGMCHRHEQGEDRHCHGLGLVSAPDLDPHLNANTKQIAQTVWHCHLVFFGLEIHLVPNPDSLFAINQCLSLTNGQHFFLTQVLEKSDSNPGFLNLDSFAEIACLACPGSLDYLLLLVPPGECTSFAPAFPISVCDLALRLRSGVQRI